MMVQREGDPVAPKRRPLLAIIAKNATANLARLGASWVIVLLIPPLLVHVLDHSSYAVWMLILQFGAYATLFDSGIQQATARFVARTEEMGDRHSMGQILSSATYLLLFAGAAVALVTTFAAFGLSRFFPSIPIEIQAESSASLLIVGLSLAATIPFSALAAFYLGLQRNEINALAGSMAKILGAAGGAWSVYHHHGLIALAIWTAAGNLLQPVVFLLAGRKQALRSLFRKSLVGWQTIREFSIFCASTMVSQLGTVLISGLDMPIVVAFDFRAAAYYAIATTISNMLIVPYGAIVSTIMPIASGMSAGDKPHLLGQVLVKTTRYSTALLCLMAMPLMLGMETLLRHWVGADYAIHALPMAEFLVGAQFIRLVLAPYATIGFSAGQQQRMLVSPFVEGLVNLGTSLLLVRHFGALGVAIGTLIGACVGVLLHFTVSMPRTDAILFSRTHLLKTAILRPLLCALLPAAALLMLPHLPLLPEKLALLTGAEVLMGFTLWQINFNHEERDALLGLLAHILRRSPARTPGPIPS